VAIVATGDEIVEVSQQPLPHQIRNSNSHSLAAQVRRAGGSPVVLPVAKDEYRHTRGLVERGLSSDLLLLSGGVSAGKYDLVEQVLADLGAEFFFDRVLIQPGQPVVFGHVRDRFFFGLPGNPASTMVTFEIFARAALELMSGCRDACLRLLFARLRSDFRHRPGLTRFLPARLESCGREVNPVAWQGSGDVFALAGSNAFIVAREEQESWMAGDMIEVMPR
jgi:molybdopterin molybdotransferase